MADWSDPWPDRLLSTADVAELLAVNKMMVHRAIANDVWQPHVRGEGSGKYNKFTAFDVIALRAILGVFGEMVDRDRTRGLAVALKRWDIVDYPYLAGGGQLWKEYGHPQEAAAHAMQVGKTGVVTAVLDVQRISLSLWPMEK